MKKGNKYYPLYQHLQEDPRDEITLSLIHIEKLLDAPLPPSAHRQRGWWSNRRTGAVQAQAWMQAGYHVEAIDLDNGLITFRKPGIVYNVQREGDLILWDANLVKALRHHMNWTQSDLAEKLGMRQQTISEWETGAYLPKRSTSKFLTLVAEQAGFPYET